MSNRKTLTDRVNTLTDRVDRIEEKLDKLEVSISSLVRERISNQVQQTIDLINKKLHRWIYKIKLVSITHYLPSNKVRIVIRDESTDKAHILNIYPVSSDGLLELEEDKLCSEILGALAYDDIKGD